MFGKANKQRVLALEAELQNAQRKIEETEKNARLMTERLRTNEESLQNKSLELLQLQRELQHVKNDHHKWESSYKVLESQYQKDMDAWNEKFTQMQAEDTEDKTTNDEMAKELSILKAQLQEMENANDERNALEAQNTALQNELNAAEAREKSLKSAAKIAEAKVEALEAAAQTAAREKALRKSRKSSGAAKVPVDVATSPLGLSEVPAVVSVSNLVIKREEPPSAPNSPPRKSRKSRRSIRSPKSAEAERRKSTGPRRPSSPQSAVANMQQASGQDDKKEQERAIAKRPTAPSPTPPKSPPPDYLISTVSPQPAKVIQTPKISPVYESNTFPSLEEVFSPKRSPLKVDTSDEARGLRTEVAVLRTKLETCEKQLNVTQNKLDEKMQELLTQGEKSYQLYDKLEKLQSQGSKAQEELASVRISLLQDIAGDGVDVTRFANISIQDLVRLSRTENQNQMQTSFLDPLGGNLGDEDIPFKQSEEDLDEGVIMTKEAKANRAAAVASDTISRLNIELQVMRQNNKRLQSKIESIEAVERTGQSAIQSMEILKKRTDDLVRRLRLEKDLRKRTSTDLDQANERVQTLTKHIEKVMIHLKHEAAAKNIALTEVKNYKKEATVLRQRNAALQKKGKARDRVMQELKEGTRILEDQLRLMDEKYVQLRTKLDWTRTTSSRETKKIQQEANKLRASFALAFSQMGSLDGSTLNFNMLNGNSSTGIGAKLKGLTDEDEDDDDNDEDSDSSREQDDDDNLADASKDLEGISEARDAKRSNNDLTSDDEEDSKQFGLAARTTTSVTRSEGPSKSKLRSGGVQKYPEVEIAARGDTLPAIESILPSNERYNNRR